MQKISYMCKKPYFYFKVLLNKNDLFKIENNLNCTVFIPNKNYSKVFLESVNDFLLNGDSINISNKEVLIKSETENTYLLISGVKNQSQKSLFSITRSENHYRVKKPWGHELWIEGKNEKYVFKEIYLKKNFRTSLQYHNFKEETNFIFSCKLDYYSTTIDNLDKIKSYQMITNEFVHVKPKIVHRFKALEDSYLYETSTSHLDDVIRIADDTNREDGRIEEEHTK